MNDTLEFITFVLGVVFGIILGGLMFSNASFNSGVKAACSGTHRYLGVQQPNGEIVWDVYEIEEQYQIHLPTTLESTLDDIVIGK